MMTGFFRVRDDLLIHPQDIVYATIECTGGGTTSRKYHAAFYTASDDLGPFSSHEFNEKHTAQEILDRFHTHTNSL